MSRASRDKGARGERAAVDFFLSLGFRAKRVSLEEAGIKGGVHGWDVEAWADREMPWRVQCKNVARNCPAIPNLFASGVTMAHVHFTEGLLRGQTIVMVNANDLALLAKQIAAQAAER